MTGQTSTSQHLRVPWHSDPLAALAARIIDDHEDSLPDLSRITVLLPDNIAARQLRRHLLSAACEGGHEALLGPRILNLPEWARQYLPDAIQLCDDQTRELQLVEALLEQTRLLGGANPWSLSESLLQLFDELTLNQIQLPETLQDFTQQLASAYQLSDSSLSPFGHEAKIVYTLWRAWQQQLRTHQQVDSAMAYVLALNHALQHLEGQAVYLAGYDFLSKAEQDWLTSLRQVAHVTVLQQAAEEPADPARAEYSRCLDAVYSDNGVPLPERAHAFANTVPASPLRKILTVFSAASNEDEARAVDVQVRQWLIEGKENIGIITENRRLARRVRALLERADIRLEDASGWALSTTSAAATLEALLQCLEEDFSHAAFLDLMKSPFIFTDLDANCVEMSVFRLEQDIILHENISRGLSRYRSHLLKRQARLPHWMPEVSPTLLGMLDRFDQAAGLCRPLLNGRHPARDYLAALSDCLQILAIEPALAIDAAGQRILQVLARLAAGAAQVNVRIGWLDFRSWLGRHLEQTNFRPAETGSPARLMGLAQSNLQHFDALIIAGAEGEFLPGQNRVSPFFNQSVRRELGLATTSEQRRLRFAYFRRLLESADQVLITLRHEEDGEPVSASPWLAQLQAFHRLAYGEELQATVLTHLVASPQSQVIRSEETTLPEPARQPSPAVPASHLPGTVSASDYQLLMDCPYQFYAARCLKLAAPETIREALAKADYGQRIHLCLQAFHSGVANLPGPFNEKLTPHNRQPAIDLLIEISDRLFADDLADNFAHRAWLQLWQAVIPPYIDWQISREATWRVSQTEVECENELVPELTIKGRLDRLDRADDQLAIVDYKTGAVPTMKEVLNGEAVQLPFYALLSKTNGKPAARIEYLKLDRPDNVGSAAILEGEQLNEILEMIEQRLHTIVQQIQKGAGLPAWPDDKKCGWCDMQTLCRRQVWEDS